MRGLMRRCLWGGGGKKGQNTLQGYFILNSQSKITKILSHMISTGDVQQKYQGNLSFLLRSSPKSKKKKNTAPFTNLGIGWQLLWLLIDLFSSGYVRSKPLSGADNHKTALSCNSALLPTQPCSPASSLSWMSYYSGLGSLSVAEEDSLQPPWVANSRK